jgi:hypothetical protein
MTRILLVSPSREIVVHDIPIYDNTDVKKVQAFIRDKENEYGEIMRLLFSLGEVRVMKPGEEIPIPLKWGGGGKPADGR